jgi:hypothetical protein
VKLFSRLLTMIRRPDERERHAHQRYVQVLQKAVQVMPGDEKLRELLREADRLMRDETPKQ